MSLSPLGLASRVSGSSHRHLRYTDIEPCRRAARDGVPLQPEPAQRRHVQSKVHVGLGQFATTVRGRMSHTATNSAWNAFCRYLEMAEHLDT